MHRPVGEATKLFAIFFSKPEDTKANMSLKAVVGQRKFTLSPNFVYVLEFLLNLRFPVCCLGIMQDVIRENKKPNDWKVS